MSKSVASELQSAIIDLGNFADGARSWDRMISNAQPDMRVSVFRNCCTEGAGFVAHGANPAAVAYALTELALRHNLEKPLGCDDGIQQTISDAFRKADRKVADEVTEITGRLERQNGAGLPDENAPERRDRAHVPPRLARLDVVCMADVPPVSIEWLWPNRIAIGKVCVLAGNGGIGKSTILCDWAARIPERPHPSLVVARQ